MVETATAPVGVNTRLAQAGLNQLGFEIKIDGKVGNETYGALASWIISLNRSDVKSEARGSAIYFFFPNHDLATLLTSAGNQWKNAVTGTYGAEAAMSALDASSRSVWRGQSCISGCPRAVPTSIAPASQVATNVDVGSMPDVLDITNAMSQTGSSIATILLWVLGGSAVLLAVGGLVYWASKGSK